MATASRLPDTPALSTVITILTILAKHSQLGPALPALIAMLTILAKHSQLHPALPELLPYSCSCAVAPDG